MFPTTIRKFAEGMKILLLALIILCDISFSTVAHLRNSLEVIPKKQFSSKNFPHYSFNSRTNSRYPSRYLRNHIYLDKERINPQIQRLSLPHRYWHAKEQRNSRVLHDLGLRSKNGDNTEHLNNKPIAYLKRSGISRSRIYHSNRDRYVDNFPAFQKNRNGLNTIIEFMGQTRREDKFLGSNDSRKLINGTNSKEFGNATLALKSEHMLQENRRELPRKKSVSFRVKRLYQNLSRFDLLYIFGLFLIFVPIASAAVLILPVVSLCWGTCKKRKKKGSRSNSSSKDVTVEMAMVKENTGNHTQNTESKSLQDIYRNFISNEIDGEGDTVAKRMKIERWLMPDSEPIKPKPRPKHHRYINPIEMESVSEEPSDVESALDVATQKDETEIENEEVNPQHFDELPEISQRRFPNKMNGMTRNNKATRQESHPFNFADKAEYTVGHNRLFHPRNIHSIQNHQTRHIPKRSAYSMVDIIPEQSSRI